MSKEQARKLVEEAKAMMEKDLRGGLGKLRQALALDPDFHELEDEIFLREDAIEKLDSLLDYIVVLLKDRKDYQACQLLKDLPANYIIEDKKQMVSDLTARIARADSLVEEARNLTKSGGNAALKIFEEALGLVPDYPGLQEEVAAVRGAFSRYQVYLENIEAAIRASNFAKAEELLKSFREVYQNDPNVRRFEVAIINKKKAARGKENLKKNLRSAGLVAVVLGVVGGGYYGYESWVLGTAAKEWGNIERLLEQEKFAQVQSGGKEVLGKLDRVRLFGGGQKSGLQSRIAEVLQSETVKQGAAGKVMVDGAYVPVADVDKVNSVKALLADGDNLSRGGDYPGAVGKFEEALAVVRGMEPALAAKYEEETKATLRTAQEGAVRRLIEESRNLKSGGDFDGAVVKLNEASQLAAQYGLPPEVIGEAREGAYEEIEQGRFREMVSGGDKQLAAGRFQEAITIYDQALAFAQDKKLGGAQTGKVRESIALAKVGILAGKGDEFSRRSRWVDAINSYSNALKFHGENGLSKELPVYRQTVDSLAKAKRVAALEELRVADRESQKYVTAGEWAKARKSYEREVALVDKGAYAADPEFAALRKNAAARLVEVDEKLFLAGKKDYLLERHRSIFKQAFGLGGEVALLDPAAVLLSSEGDTIKYSLTARSFSGSAYTLYEVIYAFNRKSNSWTMLDKKSGSKASNSR